MTAVDTQILIYSHRREMPENPPARQFLAELVASGQPWAIPWPCVHEFIAVTTRAFRPPSTLEQAIGSVEEWLASPTLVFIGETERHWDVLTELLHAGNVTGGAVHDARIAAICLQHGVTELCTNDRDFSRFPTLAVRNPLTTTP
jgi:uncharacterized protein